jgi:hypothetical protein
MKHSRARPFAALLFLSLFACDAEEARLRSEAERFVALHAAVKYDAAPKEREAQLRSLEQAVFVSQEVVAARDVCLAGHRELMRAQQVQEKTAAEIDEAVAGTGDADPMDPAIVERLQGQLQTSQRALNDAREQLRDCEARARALDLRFGKRHSPS